ncbi:MAG: helix-turn-helix domain-containing protein [Candidatus Desulforudaceae bacterium]
MVKQLRIGPYSNHVRARRESISITQEQLAKRLALKGFKVTASYISQIEAGLKHIPYGLAIAITEALGYETAQVTGIFLPESFTGSDVRVAGGGGQ